MKTSNSAWCKKEKEKRIDWNTESFNKRFYILQKSVISLEEKESNRVS